MSVTTHKYGYDTLHSGVLMIPVVKDPSEEVPNSSVLNAKILSHGSNNFFANVCNNYEYAYVRHLVVMPCLLWRENWL